MSTCLWSGLFGGSTALSLSSLVELAQTHLPGVLATLVAEYSREFHSELIDILLSPNVFSQSVFVEPLANRWVVKTHGTTRDLASADSSLGFSLWREHRQSRIETRVAAVTNMHTLYVICGTYLCYGLGKSLEFVHLDTNESKTKFLEFVPRLTSFQSRYLIASHYEQVSIFDTHEGIVQRLDLEKLVAKHCPLPFAPWFHVAGDFLVLERTDKVVALDGNWDLVWTLNDRVYQNQELAPLRANFLIFSDDSGWRQLDDFHLVRFPDGQRWRFSLPFANNGRGHVAVALACDNTSVLAGKRNVLMRWELANGQSHRCELPENYRIRSLRTWIDQTTILVLATYNNGCQDAIFSWNLEDNTFSELTMKTPLQIRHIDVLANGHVLGQGLSSITDLSEVEGVSERKT